MNAKRFVLFGTLNKILKKYREKKRTTKNSLNYNLPKRSPNPGSEEREREKWILNNSKKILSTSYFNTINHFRCVCKFEKIFCSNFSQVCLSKRWIMIFQWFNSLKLLLFIFHRSISNYFEALQFPFICCALCTVQKSFYHFKRITNVPMNLWHNIFIWSKSSVTFLTFVIINYHSSLMVTHIKSTLHCLSLISIRFLKITSLIHLISNLQFSMIILRTD